MQINSLIPNASSSSADLLQIANNKFTSTLRQQLLARLRDELDEAKQERFREAMESHHDPDS
jgi:hypothetical protein